MRSLAFLSLLLVPFFGYSQNAQPKPVQQKSVVDSATKATWLKKNALPVRSIDSSDEDFSDLLPLKKEIGDARVVLLGEQTHMDGATFLAKIRLIKFLHQQMGFDVVSFESGFYDVTRSWQNIRNGKPVKDAFREAVFFGDRGEYVPLIHYIDKTLKTNRPLEITGFDDQLTGQAGKDSLAADFKRFFQSIGAPTTHFDDTASFARQLSALGAQGGYKAPNKAFFDTFSKLNKLADSLAKGRTDLQTKYYLQLLKSTRKTAEKNPLFEVVKTMSGEDKNRMEQFSVNMRDAQMADNLLWYLANHPEKKVIVWAATFHTVSHNIAKYDPGARHWRDSLGLVNLKVMGEYLREKLGDQMYSIAFTAYGGRIGLMTNGKGWSNPIKENQRPEAEFEELMNAAGYDFAFVDLRTPAKGGEWLRKKLIARPIGNSATEGEWHKAVDGFFFIKTMFPGSKAP